METFYDTSSFPSFSTLRGEQEEQIPFLIDHSLNGTDCDAKVFELFFLSTVIDRIVQETNKYAKRVCAKLQYERPHIRKRPWKNLTRSEIQCFNGSQICMRILVIGDKRNFFC